MRKTRCFLQCTGRQPVHGRRFPRRNRGGCHHQCRRFRPGVVKHALEKVRGENFEVLCETIKKTAFKVTRVGQLVAQEASKRLNIPFGIIDLSLAPTPAIGDSVADILEEIGLEHAGAPGTTAALALLNDQVKKGGVMASSYVAVSPAHSSRFLRIRV